MSEPRNIHLFCHGELWRAIDPVSKNWENGSTQVEAIGKLVVSRWQDFHIQIVDMSNLIVRRVKVNRNRTPQEAIDATGRRQYVDISVVDAMPRGEGEGSEIFFFIPDRLLSDDDLEKEYELRGLKPADPYSLAAVNEIDPAFADNYPNSTHWKDSNGKWYYAAFDHWVGRGRSVGVDRHTIGWAANCLWFAGVRK